MTKAVHAVIQQARNSAVLPWVMLTIGVAVSFVLYSVIRENVESAAKERFDHQAVEAQQVIERRVLSYAGVLYGARALFGSRDSISRLEFHRFVESLDLKSRFPGFDSMNFASYVRAENRQKFVEAVRRDTSLNGKGYPQFAIRPPGDRPEYFVLVYVEPVEDFEFLLGLDIGANPAVAASDQRTVMNLQHFGRDTGQLSA